MTDTDDTDVLLRIPADYYLSDLAPKMKTASDTEACTSSRVPESLRPLQYVDANNFSMQSDISTITTSTANASPKLRRPCDGLGLMQSTPKSRYNHGARRRLDSNRDDESVLSEIDKHLEEHTLYLSVQPKPSPPAARHFANSNLSKSESKLISLSDLWGNSEETTAIQRCATASTQSALVEEQLRRQHLERTVQTLQRRLLEFEQRITVAIEVDRTKNAALKQAQEECKNLESEMQRLRQRVQEFELEKVEQAKRLETLETELSQAISLATKFQSNIEKLEADLASRTRQADEQQRHLEDFEIKISASKRAEEVANTELKKLQDKIAKVEYKCEKLQAHSDKLRQENEVLQQQKITLQDYHQKQRVRADQFEARLKTQDETISSLKTCETNLKRKLEIQERSMKAYYQQQLENVVAQKLAQFQEQLDKREESLRAEARDRERLIAERAMKQLEKINETNNRETRLLAEKHEEEIQLYRLQQANAAKRIEQLDEQLSNYKAKRTEIAERLHGVMEAQWQKALEILTSPNHLSDPKSVTPLEDRNNQNFQTPKSCNAQHYNCESSVANKGSSLNLVSKKVPASPMDRLQAYIQYLLSKTPDELEQLDDILAFSMHKEKLNGNKSTKHKSKPPWKS